MADTKETRGKQPLPAKPQPTVAKPAVAVKPQPTAAKPAVAVKPQPTVAKPAVAVKPQPVRAAKPAAAPVRKPVSSDSQILRTIPSKGKKSNVNPTVVVAIVAGVVVLVAVIIAGAMLGWFGGGSETPSAVATAPPPSSAQPTPSATSTSKGTPTAPATQTQPAPSPSSGGMVSPPQASSGIPIPGMPNQGAGPSPQTPAQPTVPPLPDDVSKWKWKNGDYLRARRENHPKLLDAIKYLGSEKFAGDERVAQGLIDLLKPLSPTPSGGQSGPSNPQPGPAVPASPIGPGMGPTMPGGRPANLVETIVASLGNNGSPPARKTLEQLLAGSLKTEDDKAAVEAAVQALAAHPGPDTDALLVRLLMTPEEVRPSGRPEPSAKDLRAKAIELLKPSASDELRTKLAQASLEHEATIDAQDPLGAMLLASDALNCGAQVLIYQKGNLAAEVKATLEQQLTAYASAVVARHLKVLAETGAPSAGSSSTAPSAGMGPAPPHGMTPMGPGMGGGAGMSPANQFAGTVAPGQPTKQIDTKLAARIAAHLWSDGFRECIESHLSTATAMEKQSQFLALAATIPHDSSRAVLAKVLRKRWADGPKVLETVGLMDPVVADPGLLVLVKSAKRHDYKGTSRAPGGMTAPAGQPNGAVQKNQQTEQDWMNASSKLVTTWCKRMNEAAQIKEREKKDGKKKEADAEQKKPNSGEKAKAADAPQIELPDGFKIDPDAHVTAAYRLVWPDEAPPEIAKLNSSGLEVYYVRAETHKKLSKALSFYRTQAKAKQTDQRPIDKSTWIDRVQGAAEKGRRKSIDVVITPPANYTATSKPKDETETDLTVEVLIVEIKDPGKEQL